MSTGRKSCRSSTVLPTLSAQQIIQIINPSMKKEAGVQLQPGEPTTDSRVKIVLEGGASGSQLLRVECWRRVPANHRCPVEVPTEEALSYQCSALDYGSVIEARVEVKVSGSIRQVQVSTQPVKLTPRIRERTLYLIEPLPCRIVIDELTVLVNVQVENKKIKFFNHSARKQFPLVEGLVEVDHSQSAFKLVFQHCRTDFLLFFHKCLNRTPKIKSNVCSCVFNDKVLRDLCLYLIAEGLYGGRMANNFSTNTFTPKNGYNPNNSVLKNNGSSSSLASNNTRRHKREKVKITQRLNLKRSESKLSANRVNTGKEKDMGECLNIFQDQDLCQITSGNGRTDFSANNDTAMDLRGSFEELEQKSCSKIDEDKASDHSFRQKKQINGDPSVNQNKALRQENIRLIKSLENANQTTRQAANLKKKYQLAIEEITRLENERRVIIMDKVKFQSAYHREIQEKEHLKKQLYSLKQIMSKYSRY